MTDPNIVISDQSPYGDPGGEGEKKKNQGGEGG